MNTHAPRSASAPREEPTLTSTTLRNRVLALGQRVMRNPLLTPSAAQQSRWSSEAAFFDRLAESQLESLTPFPSELLERYQPGRLRPYFNKEYRFQLLGDVRGRRILDVGCGDGSNA